MLTLSRVAKAYGTTPLFEDVSFQLLPGRRVALVGRNGAGKTTLVEMILGLQEPDEGEISRARNLRIAYLPQDVDDPGEGTVLETVLEGAVELNALEARLRELEERLEATDDADEAEALLEVYGREQHRFEQLGGYGIEAEAQRVLAGLGFAPEDGQRPVRDLSGGWRVRVALAKLLLQDPDLLVLDEPTNHLDLESIAWLETTLAEHPGALLFVSHDRDFIDAVADRIIEVAHGTAHEYVGGFAEFVAQRELRMEGLRAAAKAQQRRIADTERFIERFRYKATKARQVQSRIKALDKVDRIEVPEDHDPRLRFRFPPPRRASRVVAELDGVGKRFGDHVVLDRVDLVIERGWKIAVVGPNGAGKSTLVKLLLGALEADGGAVRLGTNVDVAYFAQHQVEALRQDRSVLEEFRAGLREDRRTVDQRTLLGAFGFSGDDQEREVRSLSGGEQTRLALGRLMADSANLLCLDEPTNHLDIASRDLLEDALVAYPGTVLLITHDRHVIRGVADHVLDVRDGGATLYPYDYETYLERTGRGPATPSPAPQSASLRPTDKRVAAEARNARYRRTRELRAEVADVERQLATAEQVIADLNRVLAQPGAYDDRERVKELVELHGRAKDRAADLMERWERAQLALEAAEQGSDGVAG